MTITITSLNQYQELAYRTNNYKDCTGSGLREAKLVAALGLVDEAIETLELFVSNEHVEVTPALLTKELGDEAWYLASTCSAFGFEMGLIDAHHPGEVGDAHSWVKDLVVAAKDVGELVKKEIGHDHPADREELREKLRRVYSLWLAVCEAAELDPMEVLAANVVKLIKRFPQGFTTEASLLRVDTHDEAR